ncbi:MAG TPA: imidazolonepropionase [Acidobacteriota bacterium]|jgi:imidazolonepropionase|nr:imidazolonepropionase [Acidobacteriota bacterium]
MLLLRNLAELVGIACDGQYTTQPACHLLLDDSDISAWGTEALDRRADVILRARIPVVAAPAFIDCHTHSVFAGRRDDEYEWRSLGISYGEIARRGGGIVSTMRSVHDASEEAIFVSSLAEVVRFAQFGTGTVEIKSGYGLELADEFKLLRVIARLREAAPLRVVATFLGAHALPPAVAADRRGFIEQVCSAMPEVKRQGLAEFADVFCDTGFFTVEEAAQILQAARHAGLKLKIHAEQLAASGGAGVAAQCGAVSADHLEHIEAQGIQSLAQQDIVGVLLPGTVFNLGLSHYPPARQMLEAGMQVAVATDFNPGSSFSQNMQLMLSISCSQMKLTPLEAFAAATRGGAAALDRRGQTGEIQKGAAADIALFAAPNHRYIPYRYGENHCVGLIREGKILFLERDLFEITGDIEAPLYSDFEREVGQMT